MADLIVTFARALSAPPIMDGNPCRTEVMAIGSVDTTTLAAAGSDNVVDLYAGADCWVRIGGEAAVPVAGETASMFMVTGQRLQLKINTGEHVSVIAAS